eukprot:CAMPEP_0201934270 /NCGR_PEP_ID=MMETSP0903-20130614/33273_1 /ASSEMBLY_ACC=CAM_ASM_000552 /TAXON_ID=420261 /ORGANISM="Thalassiosira antarctica, Strain CCMP982" /LENGTH=95 /DNA_ID=CAMNT_0048474443 /DNA_START=23 /DNA_END=310 /DNA_ORIENTATION=-
MTGTPTPTSPDPVSTSSFATIPSSCVSKSIEALTVSITANESPAAKDSPSDTFHLLIVLASIVGVRAGIRTTMCGQFLCGVYCAAAAGAAGVSAG